MNPRLSVIRLWADDIPATAPLLAFAVDDLEAAIARLNQDTANSAVGALRTWSLTWGIEQDAGEIARSRWLMAHNPAGNLIEMVQSTHPGAPA